VLVAIPVLVLIGDRLGHRVIHTVMGNAERDRIAGVDRVEVGVVRIPAESEEPGIVDTGAGGVVLGTVCAVGAPYEM